MAELEGEALATIEHEILMEWHRVRATTAAGIRAKCPTGVQKTSLSHNTALRAALVRAAAYSSARGGSVTGDRS